jgi:tol-pal system protein YbgF
METLIKWLQGCIAALSSSSCTDVRVAYRRLAPHPSRRLNQRFPMQRMFARTLIAVSLGALCVGASHAGLFDDEEARKQIVQLRNQVAEQQRVIDQRLGELESQARNRSIIDLFNQVETLRTEMARLRGQLELLQNEIENSQKRQRDLYVDLDSRMRKLETAQEASRQAAAQPIATQPSAIVQAPVVPDPARTAPPAIAGQQQAPLQVVPVADPAQEQRAYDQGLDHFRAGRYNEAVTAFQIFIRSYPRSPLASSAQYWIGNSLYAARDFRGSIAAQRQLLSQYPESNKASDALLNIATSQAELGDIQGARSTLQEVNAKYPSSEAAAKARQRLGIR